MSNINTFLQFLNELKTLERQIAELEAERDAIKDLIKEELTSEGIEETLVGDYKIIYKDVISNRFDSTTFKKTYGELYKQFTKTTTYKRLTIN